MPDQHLKPNVTLCQCQCLPCGRVISPAGGPLPSRDAVATRGCLCGCCMSNGTRTAVYQQNITLYQDDQCESLHQSVFLFV